MKVCEAPVPGGCNRIAKEGNLCPAHKSRKYRGQSIEEPVLEGNLLKQRKAEGISKALKRHGHSHRTPTYNSWRAMCSRCCDEKADNYKFYGGRGISVCDKWKIFDNFLKDMGERPSGTTIDRKDVNGNYCKANCKWSTIKDQKANMRCSKFIELDGKKYSCSEFAEIFKIPLSTVYYRIKAGWSSEDLSKPVRVRNG